MEKTSKANTITQEEIDYLMTKEADKEFQKITLSPEEDKELEELMKEFGII